MIYLVVVAVERNACPRLIGFNTVTYGPRKDYHLFINTVSIEGNVLCPFE